jgi:hypothetical protein
MSGVPSLLPDLLSPSMQIGRAARTQRGRHASSVVAGPAMIPRAVKPGSRASSEPGIAVKGNRDLTTCGDREVADLVSHKVRAVGTRQHGRERPGNGAFRLQGRSLLVVDE